MRRTNVKLTKSNAIAIVVSEFNQPVTDALRAGALAYLEKSGLASEQITIYSVPGVVEIPLVAQKLAKTERFSAIIALGAVIRGETSHYDYVCEQVSQGCQRVALDYELPVVFGVLTTENATQAWDRLGGKHGHKGEDAAECALKMINLLAEIS
ncbi:MAG: 6,7-dimethyl-8-ribityllumazine synthase [Legionellaceae bacterium]|nr:6,7-dimethyl-8-ribityllumazine synthase [Legionellaceae bacterium]